MSESDNTNEPRGIRNDNPGNLRFNPKIKWQGQTGHDGDDFCTFDNPVDGLRALAKLLVHYHMYLGLNTVGTIISRYAPPDENDTASYIQAMCEWLDTQPYTPFDVVHRLHDLVTGIVMYENGQQPYDESTIELAIHEATADH